LTIRLCFFIAVVALISTSAVADCLTQPIIINGVVQYDPDGTRKYASGFKDYWRNDLEKDFADYGLLFEDAKDRNCSLWAKQSLGWKIDDTLARATNRTHTHNAAWTNVGPYQNWLEGAHVNMIMPTALQIGGHGDMTSALDAKIQSVITSFTNNPNRPYGQNTLGQCGIGTFWKDLDGNTSDTCMDEHTVGATAYAWIAAYQNKRGNTTSRDNNITSAKTAINSAFSLDDSICLHDPNVAMSATGRGPCNVTDPTQIVSVLTRFSNPGWTYSFNRGQNQAYGFGLLASVSSALIGLEEADAPDIYGNAILKDSNGNPIAPVYLTDAQNKIAVALLKEAQRSSTPSTGDYFNGHLGGTGNCRNFGVSGGSVYWQDGKSCADSLQRARWYSLGGAADPTVAPNTFFSKYIGVTPSTTVYDPQGNVTISNAFTFNRFLWTDFVKDPATASSAHWARAVWYGNLGYYWHTIATTRNQFNTEPTAGQVRGRLAATNDDYDPIGYIDGITSTGVVYGWSCDKDLPNTSIAVDFYAGGIPGVGTYAGRTTALYSSESAINTLCSGGTMHRFSAQLPSWTQGQLIYPYGLDATWRGYYLLPPSTGCAGGYCSW
jgi:hypothetical protein